MTATISNLCSLKRLHLIAPPDADLGPLLQLRSLEDFALKIRDGDGSHETAEYSCVHALRSSRNTLQAVQLYLVGNADDVFLTLQSMPHLQTIMLQLSTLTPSAAACIDSLTAAQSIHLWLCDESGWRLMELAA